jgi:hypothetical protein
MTINILIIIVPLIVNLSKNFENNHHKSLLVYYFLE